MCEKSSIFITKYLKTFNLFTHTSHLCVYLHTNLYTGYYYKYKALPIQEGFFVCIQFDVHWLFYACDNNLHCLFVFIMFKRIE